jgi:hypothetical protein
MNISTGIFSPIKSGTFPLIENRGYWSINISTGVMSHLRGSPHRAPDLVKSGTFPLIEMRGWNNNISTGVFSPIKSGIGESAWERRSTNSNNVQ